MAGSSLLSIYQEQVPYAKQLQGLTQFLLFGYFFYLLVSWQQQQKEDYLSIFKKDL
jgi:hypothetical protein